MYRFVGILGWRARQSALVRWGGAIALFLTALIVRFGLGPFHGGNPGLVFYPAILLTSVVLGWREAVLVLCLSLLAGYCFFLPIGMYLLPIGWSLVGGLNIAIIALLSSAAAELVAANERQRVLFQELQHRVANTLQAVVSTFELARRRATSSPAAAVELMSEAAQRFAASADVHRRLSDPGLFQRALGTIVKDAVSTVIDHHSVRSFIDIEEIGLTFDQMSTVTMLVIEVANNSQKHVFRQGEGSYFSVSLRAMPGRRAVLAISDDGPGMSETSGSRSARLGFRIIRDLVAQLNGTFTVTPIRGTEIVIEFPIAENESVTQHPSIRRRSPKNSVVGPRLPTPIE